MRVQLFHEGASEIDLTRSKWHKVLPSGDIDAFDPVDAATRVREFLEDGNLWVPRTKPKPRGRGSFLG